MHYPTLTRPFPDNHTLPPLITSSRKPKSKQQIQYQLIKQTEKKSKTFFKLHPPRGGIDSKKHFGVDRGVLGDNKDKINDLIKRML